MVTPMHKVLPVHLWQCTQHEHSVRVLYDLTGMYDEGQGCKSCEALLHTS